MPLSWWPVAGMTVLMNLFVMPFSRVLTTQEHISLLLGSSCGAPSDTLPRLTLSVGLEDIDFSDEYVSPSLLYYYVGAAGTSELLAGWSSLSTMYGLIVVDPAVSRIDLPSQRYWRFANPRASPGT